MFIPSEKLLVELRGEPSGLWFGCADNETESSIVIKLTTPVLKAVLRNVPTFLFVARVMVKGLNVPIVGIRVDDDAKHPQFVSQPFINTVNVPGQTDRFFEILQGGDTSVHFFDERNMPVLSSACSLDQQQTIHGLKILQSCQTMQKEWTTLIEAAQDLFLEDLNRVFQNELTEYSEIRFIQISFVHGEPTNIVEAHNAEITAGYRLDDGDEGKAQERLVYNTLARVFDHTTYLSPSIREGASKRELTDVMGFGKKQICLIESKALSMLNVELERPTTRRASLIERDIRKGLKQLKGGFRNLKLGSLVLDAKGDQIYLEIAQDSVVHGIVLVSEMFPFLNWQDVMLDIKRCSAPKEHLFLHVMALSDLQRLCLIMPEPLAFSLHLIDRFTAVLMHRTAFINPIFEPRQSG